jgi:hypothetical protein
MRKIRTIVIVLLWSSLSFGQVSDIDSLEYIAIQDTISRILGITPEIDSISPLNKITISDDFITKSDSIQQNTDNQKLINIYQKFNEQYSETQNIEGFQDTLHYLLNKTNYYLLADSLPVDDSIFYALKKLQLYIENKDILPVIHFLNGKIDSTNFPFEQKDNYTVSLNDSINNSIRFILETITRDTLKLTFRNIRNENELFYSELGSKDSIHINLYDQRGEFVLLWIKKSEDNTIDLYLEDGTYLEKTKQRSTIQREIRAKQNDIALREIKKINLVLPQWTYKGSINLNFSQSYLSDWAAGGENSLSALSVLKYSMDLVYGKKIWDNDIEYKLGYLKAGDGPLQKNDDKLEINSKYGHAAFTNWYYSFLLNFKTQFLTGYDYPKDTDPLPNSGFMSPAFLVFSLGLDYKPSKNLTLLLSPLTSKFTIFTDTASYDQTRFGVEKDKKSKQEIGAYIKLLSKINIRKDIMLENRLNLFTNYVDNPQNVDIDWEAILNFELNEYFRFTLNTHIIYDDNIDIPVYKDINGVKTKVGVTKKLQLKEVFSVGFVYKIFH